jgi:AcrR family transcriptional regulator
MLQARAAVTRHNVLLAGAKIFEEQGFAAATIAQILQEAGVTKGAMYFHFDSKESLAQAIIEEQHNWQGDTGDQRELAVQRLIRQTFSFVHALQVDPLMRASIRLTLERSTFGTTDPSAYEGWLTVVRSLLEEADQHGELLRGVDVDAAAYVIAAAITGTQLFSEAFTGRRDLVDRVLALWEALLPGLVTMSTHKQLDLADAARTA